MPALNHRGPQGEGPRTGRGLGDCNKPINTPAPENTTQPGFGRGLGRRKPGGFGMGLGRGMGNGRGMGLNRGNNT